MSCFTRRRATPKQSTRACSGGGAIPRLSPKEYDILRLLVLHASKVLTHRMIMREVWGGAGDVHYLRVYVRQLRQKLEADPDRPRHILTKPGRLSSARSRLSYARAGLEGMC
jgi:DNA-binding response OmpR family regulator